jgi:hypothetical protein
MPELAWIGAVMGLLRDRLKLLRDDEAGYSTEAVVVIALLVAMALVAIGIIAAKVISKAKSVDTG